MESIKLYLEFIHFHVKKSDRIQVKINGYTDKIAGELPRNHI